MTVNSGRIPDNRRQLSARALMWALFAVQLAVRIALSIFPKIGTTYGDELLYLEMSQNLWLRGTLNVYHLPVRFSKILYPVLLSPFYSIGDPSARLTAISVFNALLISLSLIPGYRLARRHIRDDRLVCMAMTVLAVSPDLCFSVTFMAENLYLPLLLGGMDLVDLHFCRLREKKGDWRLSGSALLMGAWAFLLYATKEVGASFFAAVCLLHLRLLIRNRQLRRSAALSLGLFVAAFLIPLAVLRFVLFGNLPYAYSSQAGMNNLDTVGKWGFLLYASVYVLLYEMMSMLFYPVANPLLHLRQMNEEQKNLLILACAQLLMTAAGIAFAISIPDDYGRWDLRLHLRYFSASAFPFIVLFLSSEHRQSRNITNRPGKVGALAWLVLAFIVAVLVYLQPVRFGSLVDSPALYAAIWQPAGSRWIQVFYAGLILLLLGVRRMKGELVLRRWMIVLLIVTQMVHSGALVRAARQEEAPPGDPAELIVLDRMMDEMDGNILVVKSSLFEPYGRMLDSIADDDYYVVQTSELQRLAFEQPQVGTVVLEDARLESIAPMYTTDGSAYAIPSVAYIVTDDPTLRLSRRGNREITPEGFSVWRVYCLEDPTRIIVLDPEPYRVGETITFFGDDPTCLHYAGIGFSAPESQFTWTDGKRAEIMLNLDAAPERPLEMEISVAGVVAPQRYEIRINGVEAAAGTQGEGGSIRFPLPPEAVRKIPGQLRMEIRLPDAVQPDNGDPRELGLAIRSVTVSPVE